MLSERPRTFDKVELTDDVEGVPAGTIAVVVVVYDSWAMVEIPERQGSRLIDDLISVPFTSMRHV